MGGCEPLEEPDVLRQRKICSTFGINFCLNIFLDDTVQHSANNSQSTSDSLFFTATQFIQLNNLKEQCAEFKGINWHELENRTRTYVWSYSHEK